MSKPTGLARDSSLGINKAPGKCLSCREAQTVEIQYRAPSTASPAGRRYIVEFPLPVAAARRRLSNVPVAPTAICF